MLNSEEINALGQAINTTWNMSSTERGNFPVGTARQFSVSGQILGSNQAELDDEGYPIDDCKLVAKYVTVVGFRSEEELHVSKKKFDADARKHLDVWLKKVKDTFKQETGRALKAKEISMNSSCEVIYTGSPQLSMYTQRTRPEFHKGYHRVTLTFNVR